MRLLLLAALSAVLASPRPGNAADTPASADTPHSKQHAGSQAGTGTPPPAASGVPGATDTLDRARIQAEYGDGNFEVVIEMLEGYRSGHKSFRATDSLFLAKYLGVVYASNPASREKGKYWLYRMLQLDPTADLVDMYVGEAVDKAFERVRQEFIVRRNYRGINDMKLAKAVSEGERTRDTVVVRDTVKPDPAKQASLPERQLKDLRHGWTGNVNLGVGLKFMDEEQWGSTRQHKAFRAAVDFRQRRWPINIALDFIYTQSEEDVLASSDGSYIPYRQTSTELNVGVRKIFEIRNFSMRFPVGGGFGYISTELEAFDFSKGDLGTWVQSGIYWELERHFNIGAESMWSWSEINYVGGAANAGGLHFEMIFGYHW